MTRLSQMTLQFNPKLKRSNKRDELSSETGQLLFREFEKIGFTKTVFEHIRLKDEQSFYIFKTNNYFFERSTNYIYQGN